MKTISLLFSSFFCFILLVSCSSSTEDTDYRDPETNLPKVNYHELHIGQTNSLTILNKEVYYIYRTEGKVLGNIAPNSSIRKVNTTGEITTLIEFDNILVGRTDITSNNSTIYFTAGGSTQTNEKILKFTPPNYQSTAYKPSRSKPMLHLDHIEAWHNNTILYHDYYANTLRNYNPDTETDEFVLGDGKRESTDGIGQLASFSSIYDITFNKTNNLVYLIEQATKIRTIEFQEPSTYVLSTLVRNSDLEFEVLEIDSQGQVFVLVKKQGIYKLNTQNELEPYLTKAMYVHNLATNTKAYLDPLRLTNFKFDNDDLYLLDNSVLTKISNYKSELQL